MKCPKCNTANPKTAKVCKSCGAKLSPKKQKTTTSNTQSNQINVKEKYLKAYMGPKYESFKDNSFSIWTFFFESYYFLYRKIWIWGIILFIIARFLNIILYIILYIVLGLNFNSIYINYAANKITKIINENPNAPDEKIIELCQKRGNTNIVLPIILIILQILAFLIEIYIFTHKNIF